MLLAKILVRSRLASLLFCGGIGALFAMLLVHSTRSLAEYRDAPERIACEQAAHAPLWVTLETRLDCEHAEVVHLSGHDRFYASAICPSGAPPLAVAVDSQCKNDLIAYTGDLEFDEHEGRWVLYTWGGPRNACLGVGVSLGLLVLCAVLYRMLEKSRIKQGILPGRWLF